MTLQEFNNLSKKYLDGQTSELEEKYLLEWLENNKFSTDKLPTKEDPSVVKKRLWNNIKNGMHTEINLPWRQLAVYAGIAACLILAVTYAINPEAAESALAENKTLQVINHSEKQEVVMLSDGTEVYLTKNSSISYGKDFNMSRREVFLKGEAFFKVKRDVTKLFIVHSGDLSAEVLGTSFWVKENKKNKSVEVEVTTGKVSVYTDKKSRENEKNGVILTPNQKVIYDEVSQNIKQSLIEFPKPLVASENLKTKMVFQSIPLSEVLKEFSNIYGIDFIISNDRLNACRITADLNGLEMYMQLELICKSIDARYEKRGTVIFLNGDGC